MFLTGYHGATKEKANRIEREGKFPLSHGNKEWLGNGIYFYFSISDAYDWRTSDVIYHTVIKVNDDEYFDLDTREGKQLVTKIVEYICSQKVSNRPNWRTIQENQYAVMQMIWDTYPKLRVMSATFHREQTKIPLLIDPRSTRKEFCVRDNSSIKHRCLIERSELDD